MQPVKLSLMSASPSQVYLDRCLWQRHQGAACRYCLDACPSGALQFSRREVTLLKDRCLGCGVCLTACPVECFECDEWSERSLISTLARLKQPSVEVACKLHPTPHVGHDAVPVLQVSTCLGALSPGLWFEIGLEYRVQLRLDACEGCPISTLVRYTQKAVELANSWLETCNHAPTLTIQDTSPEQLSANRRIVVSAERPILNRRDFLFSFVRSSGPVEQALACLPAAFVDNQDDKIPPHQPRWLRRLAEIFPCQVEKLPDDVTNADQSNLPVDADSEEQPPLQQVANWPTLNVANHCAACGACARYCPSGALSTTVTEGKFQHIFIPGVCVACGLCAEVCRSGALTRDYSADSYPFEERVVAERQCSTCRRCGNPALAELDNLCYWCAKEPPLRSLLDNARDFLLG